MITFPSPSGRITVLDRPPYEPGPVPPHVVLDTDSSTAEWYGVYDSETVAIA